MASPEVAAAEGSIAASTHVTRGHGVVVVNAVGEFDLSTAHVLVAALDEACESGQNVLLDMSDVSFIDASTLGVVVRAGRTLAGHGCTIEIVHPARMVARLLRLTGLESLASATELDERSR
jgi:anti-sigma B factor antagonist